MKARKLALDLAETLKSAIEAEAVDLNDLHEGVTAAGDDAKRILAIISDFFDKRNRASATLLEVLQQLMVELRGAGG
jgi:hypothetical protein